MAVSSSGDAAVYRGASWHRPTPVFRTLPALTSVSCASPRFCVTVTVDGFAIPYDGQRWGTPVLVDAHSKKFGVGLQVSCPSPSFCLAISEDHAFAATFNGSSWSTRERVTTRFLSAVSCASPEFCVALGPGRTVAYDEGSSWRLGTSTIPDLDSVSCPTARFCAATDRSGNVITYNGRTWSAPTHLVSAFNIQSSVSCPSASYCVAVLGDNPVATFDGTFWTRSQLSRAENFYVVSCPDRSFCAALDELDSVAIATRGRA